MSFKITSDIINGLIFFDILFIVLTIWTRRIKSRLPIIILSVIVFISIGYKFLISNTAPIASTPVDLELRNFTDDDLKIWFVETDSNQNEKIFYWDRVPKDETKSWTFELESNLNNGLGLITWNKTTDSKKWLTVDLNKLPATKLEIRKEEGIQLNEKRNHLVTDVGSLELKNWVTTVLTVISVLIIGFRFTQ